MQCACKLLNLWASDGSLPSLGLDVNVIQSKMILFDDSVNSLVAAAPNGAAGVISKVHFSPRRPRGDRPALHRFNERRSMRFRVGLCFLVVIASACSMSLGEPN